MARTILAAAFAVLGLAACGDGQTGAEYRGEPLMSLRGVVTSSESALTQDLVPALSFVANTEYVATEGKTFTTHFVKGEVEGTFPSAFTLRIYEPPPSAVMDDGFVPGEPRFAGAQIVAVSPDHPSWLRNEDYYEAVLEDGVEVGGTQHNEVCADSGECISGDAAQCPEGVYDLRAEWPCGAAFPDNLPWEVYGYSSTYSIVYFEGDVLAGTVMSKLFGGGGPLASGYHSVRHLDPTTLPAAEQAAALACSQLAYEQAIDATNALYGTSATAGDQSQLQGLDKQDELGRQNLIAYAELDCPPLLEVIDPESDPIELPFTDEPQSFLW